MKTDTKGRNELLSIKAAMFGLAATDIAFLLHVLGQGRLDRPLCISLYCLVAAIPLLVGLASILGITTDSDPPTPLSFDAWIVLSVLWISPVVSVAAIAACIWHYSAAAALTFLASVAVAFVTFMVFQAKFMGVTPNDVPDK